MKIRSDFVTNSSSSSFTLELSFVPTEGEAETISLYAAPEAWDDVDSCSADAIELVPEKVQDEAHFSGKSIRSAANIDELCDLLFETAMVEAYEPKTPNNSGLPEGEVAPMKLNGVQADVMARLLGTPVSTYAEVFAHMKELLQDDSNYDKIDPRAFLVYFHMLAGKTVALGGIFRWYDSEAALVEYIQLCGGRVSPLGEGVDFLVIGSASPEPETEECAKALGIPVLSEQEFIYLYDEDTHFDHPGVLAYVDTTVKAVFPKGIAEFKRNCEARHIDLNHLDRVIIRNIRSGAGDSAIYVREDEPHLELYRQRYKSATADEKPQIVREAMDFLLSKPVLAIKDNCDLLPEMFRCAWQSDDAYLEKKLTEFFEKGTMDPPWLGDHIVTYTIRMADGSFTRTEAVHLPLEHL